MEGGGYATHEKHTHTRLRPREPPSLYSLLNQLSAPPFLFLILRSIYEGIFCSHFSRFRYLIKIFFFVFFCLYFTFKQFFAGIMPDLFSYGGRNNF